jgi:hypothetical protein
MESNDIENGLANVLLPKLIEWNITVDELRQKVGQEIYKILNVEIDFFPSSTAQRSTVPKNLRTELITSQVICYQLPMKEILFISESDTFQISAEIQRPLIRTYPHLRMGQMMLDFSSTSFVYALQALHANLGCTTYRVGQIIWTIRNVNNFLNSRLFLMQFFIRITIIANFVWYQNCEI